MTAILRTETFGRLRVEFLDNRDTPVMVYCGIHSATYTCALYTGAMGDDDSILFSDAENSFLEDLEEDATEHFDLYREADNL